METVVYMRNLVAPKSHVMRNLGVVALLIVLLAGCGGTGYTKRDFVERADGACLSTTRALRSLTPPRFTGTAAQRQRSLSTYLARVSQLVQSEARRLSALPKPPGDRAERELLTRWLTAVHASASGIQELAAAARAGDAAAVSAARAALATVPVVKLASRYGAVACAGPSVTA
jgi:hypothetical protein